MSKNPKSTISDKDWQSLKDRANKAHPDAWKVSDPEGAKMRKRANDNYQNRDNN